MLCNPFAVAWVDSTYHEKVRPIRYLSSEPALWCCDLQAARRRLEPAVVRVEDPAIGQWGALFHVGADRLVARAFAVEAELASVED